MRSECGQTGAAGWGQQQLQDCHGTVPAAGTVFVSYSFFVLLFKRVRPFTEQWEGRGTSEQAVCTRLHPPFALLYDLGILSCEPWLPGMSSGALDWRRLCSPVSFPPHTFQYHLHLRVPDPRKTRKVDCPTSQFFISPSPRLRPHREC